jgi:hypothetical protein
MQTYPEQDRWIYTQKMFIWNFGNHIDHTLPTRQHGIITQ